MSITKKTAFILLASAVIAAVLAVVLSSSDTEFNIKNIFLSQKIITTSEISNTLRPFPNSVGVKKTALQDFGLVNDSVSITTYVYNQEEVPYSATTLSADGKLYAAGKIQQLGDAYTFNIYLLKEFPAGVIRQDAVRYIFLNLFFESFASDSNTKPEARRFSFQAWAKQLTNYAEIDGLIEKTTK